MLSSAQHSQAPLNLSPAAESAFTQIKDALADASLLVHPIPDAPTCIVTDASDTAVGAVLQQLIGEDWSPIAFFSKKLQPSETRYSAFDRELLAAYLAIKHFRHFVEGRSFHILTDHKPLTYALQKNSDRLSPFRKAQILTCNSDSHNGSRDHLHIRPKEFHTHYVILHLPLSLVGRL